MDNEHSSQESHRYVKQKKGNYSKFVKTPNKVGCLVEHLECDSSLENQESTSTTSMNDIQSRPLNLNINSSNTLVRTTNGFL